MRVAEVDGLLFVNFGKGNAAAEAATAAAEASTAAAAAATAAEAEAGTVDNASTGGGGGEDKDGGGGGGGVSSMSKRRRERRRTRSNRGTPNEAADAAAAADNAEAAEQLSPLLDAVAAAGGIPLKDLTFVRRRVYDLDCNWKVFVDNYLDGGYHIPYAHEALAEGIDMDSYSSRPIGIGSVQEVSKPEDADGLGRLGTGAAYGYIYPNFMLNRYGPWLDTNTVYPLGEGRCRIFFDYFLETEIAVAEGADNVIEESLGSSNVVQDEDEMLCLGVQASGIPPSSTSVFGKLEETDGVHRTPIREGAHPASALLSRQQLTSFMLTCALHLGVFTAGA